jgi:hypothetical protein
MNHVHPLDCTMAKVALFPYRLWFISLASNLQKPFTGWLIRFCGGVPLPDDIHGMAALERGMEARIRGGALCIFTRRACWCRTMKACGRSIRVRLPPRCVQAVRWCP